VGLVKRHLERGAAWARSCVAAKHAAKLVRTTGLRWISRSLNFFTVAPAGSSILCPSVVVDLQNDPGQGGMYVGPELQASRKVLDK
jgi:hypothetical protein